VGHINVENGVLPALTDAEDRFVSRYLKRGCRSLDPSHSSSFAYVDSIKLLPLNSASR
jgi:hypothetical protein